MARASAGDVISHWSTFIQDFQTSPLAFYEAVEAGIRRRQIPDASTSRVDWKEGGVLAARREYLRVERGKLIFDICAAPFGTGFFFSWWLAKPSPSAILGAILSFLGVFALMGLLLKVFGFWLGLFLTVVLVPIAFLVLGNLVRTGVLAIEDELLAVPVLGTLYNWIFKPYTYYKMDTALMFRGAVRGAVEEVIDGLLTAKGLRGLAEFERKPVLEEFGARRQPLHVPPGEAPTV